MKNGVNILKSFFDTLWSQFVIRIFSEDYPIKKSFFYFQMNPDKQFNYHLFEYIVSGFWCSCRIWAFQFRVPDPDVTNIYTENSGLTFRQIRQWRGCRVQGGRQYRWQHRYPEDIRYSRTSLGSHLNFPLFDNMTFKFFISKEKLENAVKNEFLRKIGG